MKLLARYNRVNIIATVIVLLLSGLCYYFAIRYVLISQLDDDLKVEEQEIIDHVKANNTLPNPSSYKDQKVVYLQNDGTPVKRAFSSPASFSPEEKEEITNRQVVFPIQVAGKNYTVIISKSEEATEDLIQLILLLTLALVVLLLLVLFTVNRFLLNKLWRPFNTTLQELKQFNLSNNAPLRLEKTSINEFSDLNEAVTVMSSRVSQDYRSLKEFTENASHEMQTPLAIINSKLDVLIQDETISEYQMRQLQGIYDALDRLTGLNQSLLLLAKIENNQFHEKEAILPDQVIRQKLSQFEELIESKKLHVVTDLQPITIQYNKQLIDILAGNLLSNAIRYNREGGAINITLGAGSLQVSNDSDIPALDGERIFQRFYRHNATKPDGNGLGLSIVKQICDMAGYTVDYAFHNGRHQFTIYFKAV
jgi:signal transduction histidine kinase